MIQDFYRTDIVSSRILFELNIFDQYAKDIRKNLKNINYVKILLLKDNRSMVSSDSHFTPHLLTMPVTLVEYERNFSVSIKVFWVL